MLTKRIKVVIGLIAVLVIIISVLSSILILRSFNEQQVISSRPIVPTNTAVVAKEVSKTPISSTLVSISTPVVTVKVSETTSTVEETTVTASQTSAVATPTLIAGSIDPIHNIKLWADPKNLDIAEAVNHAGNDSKIFQQVGSIPQAIWLGEWITDPFNFVNSIVSQSSAEGKVPVFVLYYRPHRDSSGNYSAGGAKNKEDYQKFVDAVVKAIADRQVILILEPDSIPELLDLPADKQADAAEILSYGIKQFAGNNRNLVFLDASHSHWKKSADMIKAIKMLPYQELDGLALNVSSYYQDSDLSLYGDQIVVSLSTPGHPLTYIIDSSRNGGVQPKDGAFCNIEGAALGLPSSMIADPRYPNLAGRIWIKRPSESDGNCHPNDPPAGQYWPERLLILAKAAGYPK